MGQGGARRQAADRVIRQSALPVRSRFFRYVDEGQADPVFLDPGDPALMNDRGVLRHHQAKALRDEGRVLDVDRRALERDIPHHATHHRTARRHIGRLRRSRFADAFASLPSCPASDIVQTSNVSGKTLNKWSGCTAAFLARPIKPGLLNGCTRSRQHSQSAARPAFRFVQSGTTFPIVYAQMCPASPWACRCAASPR